MDAPDQTFVRMSEFILAEVTKANTIEEKRELIAKALQMAWDAGHLVGLGSAVDEGGEV
jgi:hypothetical protein